MKDAAAVGERIEEQAKNFFAFLEAEKLPRDALFILVLGMTGSGKSTFISQCTGKRVTIEHDLIFCKCINVTHKATLTPVSSCPLSATMDLVRLMHYI